MLNKLLVWLGLRAPDPQLEFERGLKYAREAYANGTSLNELEQQADCQFEALSPFDKGMRHFVRLEIFW